MASSFSIVLNGNSSVPVVHKRGLQEVLSAYEDRETVIKGINLGACYYWAKPVRSKEIENIWHRVLRKRIFGPWSLNNSSGTAYTNGKGQSETTNGERVFEKRCRKYSGNKKFFAHRCNDNKENEPELLTRKKPRMAWTDELHDKFVEAVRQIGIDKAVPKKILAMMGVDNISTESIASHLQKYRLHLKRDRDNARMNLNPLTNASERYNSIWNRPGSFNNGRYRPSTAIASSNPASLFTRINHTSALGACGAVLHGSNMFSKDVMPGSSLLPNVRQLPNDTMRLDAFASRHFCNSSSYATLLRGKLLETSKGNESDISFAYRSNDGMYSPINRFPVQSSSRLGHPTSIKRNPFGDIGNCLGNSWQAATKFTGLGHKEGRASLGPSHANFPNISQLTGLATSSVGQIPMCRNELPNQMAAIMSNTTNMGFTHEKNVPFDAPSNNNTSSVQMWNGNFELGSSSGTSFVVHDLQIGTSAVPTQMLNGGGADGALPMQEDGTVHLETIADRLKYINDYLFETDVPEGSLSVDDNVPNDDISIYDYLDRA